VIRDRLIPFLGALRHDLPFNLEEIFQEIGNVLPENAGLIEELAASDRFFDSVKLKCTGDLPSVGAVILIHSSAFIPLSRDVDAWASFYSPQHALPSDTASNHPTNTYELWKMPLNLRTPKNYNPPFSQTNKNAVLEWDHRQRQSAERAREFETASETKSWVCLVELPTRRESNQAPVGIAGELL
jgi:hypothetical protein